MTTMLQPRRAVQRMKEYHPPLSGREGLRLDFNENTGEPSPRVCEVLRRISGETLTRYPERAAIEPLVAGFLKVATAQVLLTNGVDEAIHLLCQTYVEAGAEVLIVVPTFSMYEIYAQSAGAEVIAIPADPKKGFRFPIEELLAAIGPSTRLIAIANPNNPTGAVVSRGELLRIAESAPQAAVLVDEAYYEFYGQTILDAVLRFPNLFVARTFSKAYGLAGLRIGVLAGNADPMAMVRKVSSPYNANAVALACLPEALADREFVQAYVDQVTRGREDLTLLLAAQSIPYWNSYANFVLADVGRRHGEFVLALGRRGVLVRDRSGDPGCEGCVRITVGAREHTRRLLSELPEAFKAIGWNDRSEEVSPLRHAGVAP